MIADNPQTRRRPTIVDVASVAGVSRGTVSRVINGGRWVSPESRHAVEKAIRATGYRTNAHARSLVTGRSNTLAFLLTEAPHFRFQDPNMGLLIQGASEGADSHDVAVVLLLARTSADRQRVIGYIQQGHVDGVMLTGGIGAIPMIDELLRHNIPTVISGPPRGYENLVPYVSTDERDAGKRATAHLMSLGRHTIATITGPLDTNEGVLRFEGYREALGDDFDDRLVAHGMWGSGTDSGYQAMRELLALRPDIDAVFAQSDGLAAGTMAALKEAGRRIPQDVAVCGFDDSGFAATLDPPLTSMHMPFDQIGAEMVRIVLASIDNQSPASIAFRSPLVQRSSA